jgi:hypothetical protein
MPFSQCIQLIALFASDRRENTFSRLPFVDLLFEFVEFLKCNPIEPTHYRLYYAYWQISSLITMRPYLLRAVGVFGDVKLRTRRSVIRVSISESNRLTGSTGWIDLGFVERERTPPEIIETGIQHHLAGLSLSNTKQYLERLGVNRSRTAIHNWIQKADLQLSDGASPNRVAVIETAIQIGSDRFWLYAAVDPRTNEFLHVDAFPVQN